MIVGLRIVRGAIRMGLLSKLFGKNKDSNAPDRVTIETPKTEVQITSQSDTTICEPGVPSYQGDYAKTIFLWANAKATPVKTADNYVHYLLYECGIRDANKYHRDMIKEGYLVEAPVASVLKSRTIADLKQILSEMGQTVSGNKSILIDRIIHNADESILGRYVPDKYYELSDKGRQFVVDHNDYVLIHKHKNWGIDWHEYEVNHKPGCSYYDTMWSIFNKRIVNNPHHFGRYEYFCMHQLYEEVGKRELALEMLLRVLYIDLSGVCGLDTLKLYKDGFYSKEELIDYFDSFVMLAPGIVNGIIRYHDIFNDSFIDHLYEQKLPIQICEKKLFLEIVHSILDGSYNEEYTKLQLRDAYSKTIARM